MSSCASLDIGPAAPGLVSNFMAIEALQWFSYVRSHPVTSISPCKSGGCCFPERPTYIMSVVVVVCVSFIHFVILEASSTSLSCNSSSSVIHDVGLSEDWKEHSLPLMDFTSINSFCDQLSLGTSNALPVLVNLLCTFTQGYFRCSTSSNSVSVWKFPQLMPNFRHSFSVSIWSPSSSITCLLFLLTVQPSFTCSWLVCVIVSGWWIRIRSVNCMLSITLFSGQ